MQSNCPSLPKEKIDEIQKLLKTTKVTLDSPPPVEMKSD
jgi:hypothetical protein